MYRPNIKQAADLCECLMAAMETFREANLSDDHEGRTMGLGVTMFAGTFMAAVPFEDRQMMCDAMQGYALTARETLETIRQKE